MNASAERQPGPRSRTIAIVALIVGVLIGWYGWTRAGDRFYYSYLTAWFFWTGLSLGCLSLLLLHNLTGGKWGDAIRPLFRSAASVLPVMGLLFLPIALEPQRLYEWADPSHVEQDPILQHKAPYLDVEFFQIRAAVYFAVWLALLAMLAWQARTVAPPESSAERRFRRLSGQGVALHGLAVTFASIDWLMSLEPHWFSTIYGVIVFVSQGLAALALAIVLSTAEARRAHAITSLELDSMHDQGKLLLGFVMFWAYVSFSQFFIIWYGNLPEEVVWYIARFKGAWLWVALSLAFLHFALPFVLLLGRQLKRTPAKLGGVAMLIVIMHWVETIWLIQPAHHGESASTVPWLDMALTAAIGGLWWILFTTFRPRAAALTATRREARHGLP